MLDSMPEVRTFRVVSAAISRAIMACRPAGHIAVSVKLVSSQQCVDISVADTGRAFSGALEVAWSFNVLSSTGVFDDSITVHIRTTGLDETLCREFAVTAKRGTSDPMTGPFRPVPHVTELPSSAKGCPNGQFSGSEVSFAVTADACHWLDLLNAVQAAVETSLMVAPPASLEQRIQGFDEHVQGMGLEPLPKKIQFALEPPLDTMTPSERLTEGLRAYFLEAPMPEPAELLPSSQEPDTSQQTAVFVSSDQAGAAPRPRSATWTACAGLVTSGEHVNVALLNDTSAEHPGVKLLLFENYGLLQRPQDGILKALERVDWVQYNMPLEGIVKHADGSATLKFAQTVDQSSTDIRLIVFHLVSSELSFKKPKKGLMPPGLWLQLEAKLVKNAVEDALGKLKQSRPLTMQSPFEQRMACLSHISRSIAGIVSSSDNPDFQRQALQLANSSLEDLPIKIQACLEQIALDVMAAAANSSQAAVSQGADAEVEA